MASFCHKPGVVLSTILDGALGDAATLVVIEIDRESTAAASMQKLFKSIEIATLPGSVIEGRPTPVAGGVLVMRRVGIVVRDQKGVRMNSPDGDLRPPDVWVPVNAPDKMVVGWGKDVLATMTHH